MHNKPDPDLLAAIVLFILFALSGTGLLALTWNHRPTLSFQVKLFLSALATRFLMSIIIYSLGFVEVLKDEDASGWVQGSGLYKEWVRKSVSLFDLPGRLADAFNGQHRGYGFMVGALFYMTDAPARLPAAVLNCFLGALTVVFVYRISRTLFSEWVSVRVAWLTCLLPSMLIWSSQTLKEPVVIFLETVVMYGCVRLKTKGFSVRHILMCALAIILVLPFRFYAAYIAGAAVAAALILPNFGKGKKISVGSGIAVAACIIPIVMMSGLLVHSEAQVEQFDLQKVQKFRTDIQSEGHSSVKSSYDLNTPGGLVMGTTTGACYLLLAPFPWQLGGGSARMAMTLPELIVWWWIFFVGVLPGIWYLIRRRFNDIQPLLFFLLGLGILYSMMFGNVGLAYRQRAQLLPWLLIFGMVGLERRMLARKSRKQQQRAATAILPIRSMPGVALPPDSTGRPESLPPPAGFVSR